MGKQKQQERDDFNPSWFLVVLMLSVFWPVGLWFLWSKLQHLGESNEKGRKRGLTSGGVALLVFAAIFITGSDMSLGWFLGLGGVGMFLMNMFLNKREKKYRRYVSIISGRPVVELSEIASATGGSEEDVRRDLQKMIEDGWFGDRAYLDLGRSLFVASAEYAPKDRVKPAARAQAAPAQKKDPTPKAQPAPAPSKAENEYVQKLREIRSLNEAIKNEKVSAQIDRIEQICGNIFEAVTVQPEKSSSAHTFLNYYLPTTLKLLSAYSRLEKQGVSGENINSAKKNIEDLLDRLVWAFERQNDQLFAQDAMDINADIKVMNTMLQKDGLAEGGSGMPSDPFGEVLGRRGGAAVAVQRKEG